MSALKWKGQVQERVQGDVEAVERYEEVGDVAVAVVGEPLAAEDEAGDGGY